ncbi:MAG: alpha/beta hydrolase [Parvularculaceae bacterium]|nr:alpha/beta hydrolase [Parvularculaceae bacterium]
MAFWPVPHAVDIGKATLSVHEAGAGPAIVLVHGWPEIAYSWKNQLAPLAGAGYRVIAPDLKGFGRSSAPTDKALYDIRHMTDDLVRLLDVLQVERAIFCGHDWGGAIVWPMAQLHPERVAGVIGVCTPHRAPPPAPPLAIIKKRFGEKHYFIQFQEEGTVERLFETDAERFFRLMFRRPPSPAEIEKIGVRMLDLPGRFRDGPAPDPASVIVGADDLQVYVDAYGRSGFHGGINLYRNIDRNYDIMRAVDQVIDKPALWVGAALDVFLPPSGADGMEELVPDLEKAIIDDCGHWVMWEQPAKLNQILLDWLGRKFPSKRPKI